MRSRSQFGRVLLFGLWGVVGGGAPMAQAQPTPRDPVQEIVQRNRESLELFETLEFEMARKALEATLAFANQAGVAQHRAIARTRVYLAIVLAEGLHEDEAAVEHLRAALAIDRAIELPAGRKSARLEELLKRARTAKATPPPKERGAPTAEARAVREVEQMLKDKGGSTESAAPAAKDDLEDLLRRASPDAPTAAGQSATGAVLRCPDSAAANAGSSVRLECLVATTLKPASMVLRYRRPGEQDFASVTMTRARSNAADAEESWVGHIPGHHVRGRQVAYFFEARDSRGEPIALAGADDQPNVLLVRGGSEPRAPSATVVAEDAENPLAEREANDDDGPPAERLWVSFGLGTGAGYAGSTELEGHPRFSSGLQPGVTTQGGALLMPEIGYRLSRRFALALAGRHQLITSRDTNMATGAHAVMLRAIWSAASGVVRPYGVASVGGGEGFRLLLQARDGQRTFRDTVRGGPLLGGIAGGLAIPFGEAWSAVVEVGILASAPSFSMAFDAVTGLRFAF